MLNPFASNILTWYKTNKRTLPWRSDNPEPYAVWISEIMLQQTTVPAVIGYYSRWLEHFPTIGNLASASIDDVLRYWAGLGYYSRARNIHKTAQLIVNDNEGRFPSKTEELRKLPGIGRYTAGAIASIAFHQDEAVVDANVKRVLSREFGLKVDSNEQRSLDNRIWDIAQKLVPGGSAGEYNQALMDLGSAICTPLRPLCTDCPVSKLCVAFKSGGPETYPGGIKAKTWNELRHVSVALTCRGKVLLAKRSDDTGQWWAGMWELPRVNVDRLEDENSVSERIISTLFGKIARAPSARVFGTVKHVVTNNKISLTGFTIEIDQTIVPTGQVLKELGYSDIIWNARNEIDDLAISSPQKRLMAKLFSTESK